MSSRKPMFFTVVATLLLFSAQSHAAAYLGVVLGQRSDDAKGAVIADVHDGSPAAKAKLAVGDVIVTVNDTNIKDASALVVKMRSLKAGDEVKFKIRRDGEEKTLTVKLGKRPESGLVSGGVLGGRSPAIGSEAKRPDEPAKKEKPRAQLKGQAAVQILAPSLAATRARIYDTINLLELQSSRRKSSYRMNKPVRSSRCFKKRKQPGERLLSHCSTGQKIVRRSLPRLQLRRAKPSRKSKRSETRADDPDRADCHPTPRAECTKQPGNR